MAKCAVCDKAVHFGNNVSHSHRRSNKIWKSNIKHVKVKTEDGAARKMYVCTSLPEIRKSGKSLSFTNNRQVVWKDGLSFFALPESCNL